MNETHYLFTYRGYKQPENPDVVIADVDENDEFGVIVRDTSVLRSVCIISKMSFHFLSQKLSCVPQKKVYSDKKFISNQNCYLHIHVGINSNPVCKQTTFYRGI